MNFTTTPGIVSVFLLCKLLDTLIAIVVDSFKDTKDLLSAYGPRGCGLQKNLQNNFFMDEKKLIEQLKRARLAIDSVLRSLESARSAEVVGTCLYCREPITDVDTVFRQVHSRCYYRILDAQKRGEITFEQLESLGKVGPVGKTGRKRKPLTLEQLATQTLAESIGEQAAKIEEKNKRKKKT